MGIDEQFLSLTSELMALKDRVRNFRQTRNWQADGEWKELVLRAVLQRHLPSTFEPLRGFVTNGADSSRQTDVLIYDNTKPSLFRGGDLVFVTPDATAGVIEVKSSIPSHSKLKSALEPLAANISMIRRGGNAKAFAGLFAFDTGLEGNEGLSIALECLQETSNGEQERIVNMLCLGADLFILFWEGLDSASGPARPRWRAYELSGKAPGYFVNNVVYEVAPGSVQGNLRAWFPQKPVHQADLEKEAIDLGYGVIEPFKHPGR